MKFYGNEKQLLTWGEVCEAFEDVHAFAGDLIDSVDEWELKVLPVVGTNRGFLEDRNAEPYDFGRSAVDEDPTFYDVFEEENILDVNGEPMYYIEDTYMSGVYYG